ncbi:hypothetical protein D3C87_2144260 [compost metagenome]
MTAKIIKYDMIVVINNMINNSKTILYSSLLLCLFLDTSRIPYIGIPKAENNTK